MHLFLFQRIPIHCQSNFSLILQPFPGRVVAENERVKLRTGLSKSRFGSESERVEI